MDFRKVQLSYSKYSKMSSIPGSPMMSYLIPINFHTLFTQINYTHNYLLHIIYTNVKIGYVSIRSKTLTKHYIHNHVQIYYHVYDKITTGT